MKKSTRHGTTKSLDSYVKRSLINFVFKKKATENEATARASLHFAHLLKKIGKSFRDIELIKKC